MKISRIVAAQKQGPDTLITVLGSQGAKHELELSPLAESELITALLTRRPAVIGRDESAGLFVASNLRLFEEKRGYLVLEVFLTPKSAIQIALPTLLAERLHQLLGEDRSTWSSDRPN